MKKRNVTLWVLAFFAFASQAFAQTNVNMPLNTGPVSFTVTPIGSFYNFFDNGGAAGAYSSGSGANSVATFQPISAATHKVCASFTSFSLEAGWDALYVFNGANTAAPLISAGTGAT
jgi:hypothetical protein